METQVSSRQVVGDLTWLLPQLNSRVPCPNVLIAGAPRLAPGETYCAPHEDAVYGIVIHLNDRCGWSREQVADWLDTLDVDLTFPIEAPPRPTDEELWASDSNAKVVWLEPSSDVIFDEITQWQTAIMDFVWPKGCGKSYYAHYYLCMTLHSIEENQYKQLAKRLAQCVDFKDLWLGSLVEESKSSEKPQLKADAEAPDLLKRPDGTALPELTTDVFMKWADGTTSVMQSVTLAPSVLAELDAKRKPKPRPRPAQPAIKDFNYRKKGQPSGRHSRT